MQLIIIVTNLYISCISSVGALGFADYFTEINKNLILLISLGLFPFKFNEVAVMNC